MKIALVSSVLIIFLLGFLLIKQGLEFAACGEKSLDHKEEAKSYELLTSILLNTKDKQFEVIKEQISSDFSFIGTPTQYSVGAYGVIIRWKGSRLSKMSQYSGLELVFDKEDILTKVRTHRFKERDK
ncbi:hypothetical protein OAC51_03115 [Flavobacteriaceae bacterium]|nr:hypothetical protein [Flavobacteriaceae bacterium]